MILKKIILENIRSYENQEIGFVNGSTLLIGDIGCGKTSVLMALEFALFGLQPGQRGHSLLRSSSHYGGVSVELFMNGESVLIERTLKRAKTVNQDLCSITINGEKNDTSVSELKSKVLELLNYPKEFAKKQNSLYRFTVYTPQEQMKSIILEDSQTRVNTLRHVFGVDKYKRILENVQILNSKIREEKRLKEGFVESLEEEKMDLISKEDILENQRYNLVSVEKELFIKSETRKKIEEEKQEFEKKLDEKKTLSSEIEKNQIVISSKKSVISDNLVLIKRLKEQILQDSSIKIDPKQKIKNLEDKKELLEKRKKDLREKIMDFSNKLYSFNVKISESEKIIENIKDLKSCPTCLQEVDPIHKSNTKIFLENNISQFNKKIESLAQEKKSLDAELLKTSGEIGFIDKEIGELNILDVKQAELKEKEKRVAELEKNNANLKKDIDLLEEHIKNIHSSVFELSKFENLLDIKLKEFKEAMEEEKSAEIKVVELKKEIEVFSYQIEELRKKIKEKEKVREILRHLNELESWANKKFIPLISIIERNVMVKLRHEFSTLFNKWFVMLVPDAFVARLSDDFTPIIEQQDYDLDYSYLSGGERTAVALAYRLALNQVINSLLSEIKTKGLIILDEPTEGFSSTQLDKLRDVLQELNVNQLIIVSHEPKIESFVENVIKFKKENNVTIVEK